MAAKEPIDTSTMTITPALIFLIEGELLLAVVDGAALCRSIASVEPAVV